MRTGLTIGGLLAVLAAAGVANLGPATPADAPAVAARLAAVPTRIGDWLAAEAPIPEKQLQVAEADAHLSRTYTNGRTGHAVGILVLSGRPGPLGAHTPEVCYGAAGFQQVTESTKRPVAGSASPTGDPTGDLWTARFEAPGFPPRDLQLCWGWSRGSAPGAAWEAAADPRVRFAGESRVFKLYATRGLSPGGAGPDPTAEFLSLFLMDLRAALNGPPVALKGPTP